MTFLQRCKIPKSISEGHRDPLLATCPLPFSLSSHFQSHFTYQAKLTFKVHEKMKRSTNTLQSAVLTTVGDELSGPTQPVQLSGDLISSPSFCSTSKTDQSDSNWSVLIYPECRKKGEKSGDIKSPRPLYLLCGH